MGTVIINGQKYDSVTGLQINESELSNTEAPPASKPHRQSKQERLAEAIAQEFSEDMGDEIVQQITVKTHSTKRELPSWISEFTERQAETANQPAWITNYISGNDPIEIQPIGLEAAARDNAEEQTKTSFDYARTTPQNTRRAAQHSSTLNRNFVQKPVSETQVKVAHRQPAHVAKHPDVHHFATSPAVEENIDFEPIETTKTEASFVPVMTRSMEEKLAQRELASAPTSSSDLKNALINEQMSQPVDQKSRRADRQALTSRRRFAAPTLITAVLAILVLGGYFTYVSMPSISIRVAAVRAGIDARAPYTPSGYSIDGPVAYAPGSVTIKYKSNGGGEGYSLTQQKNEWGDSAVTDVVDNSNYTTIKAGNVTVYRYGSNAAWVYNGILFTLNGNSTLGDEQVTRIAESV